MAPEKSLEREKPLFALLLVLVCEDPRILEDCGFDGKLCEGKKGGRKEEEILLVLRFDGSHREAQRETERQRGRDMEVETQRHRDTDTQTHRHTERHTERRTLVLLPGSREMLRTVRRFIMRLLFELPPGFLHVIDCQSSVHATWRLLSPPLPWSVWST